MIGVDEHAWRHVTGRDRFVTVIIDLTPVRNKTGPARLLDMVAGSGRINLYCSTLDTSFMAQPLRYSVIALADDPDATGWRSRVGPNQAITTATTGATSGCHTHFGFDQLLEDHPYGLADEIDPITGAKYIKEVRDGRIGQGHR